MLEIDALEVRYGAVPAVRNFSLSVAEGEIVGLIGPNGAGKSTLMNAVSGFVPYRGTVEILGTPVGRRSPARRAALGLGRTFQSAELFPDLTVRETVQSSLPQRFWQRLWEHEGTYQL